MEYSPWSSKKVYLDLELMLIGHLSKETGLTRDTIRFYEKRGLIPAGVRESKFNSYKSYPIKTLEKLLFIKKMKKFGFTLKEISEFLQLLEFNTASCKNVSEKMSEKVRVIDDKIEELEEMKGRIIESLNSCLSRERMLGNCPLVSVDL